jgi:hypothetical protein
VRQGGAKQPASRSRRLPLSQAGSRSTLAPRAWARLTLGFLALAFAIYAPALSGPFFSDDVTYVLFNPYVLQPGWSNLRAILDPGSDVNLMVANYAPLHLIAHALQVPVFQTWLPGYHGTNVVLHALASLLLAALLLQARVSPAAAVLGGAFFLVHPANVEAVAWISQLKSSLALVLMLAALLLAGRRPVLGTLSFGLSLTSKALAAIALPFAALREWTRAREATASARHRGHLVAWLVIFAAFAVTQLAAFRHAHVGVSVPSEDPGVRLWTTAAIGARYLAMAATSYGVAAFHELPPVTSPRDPWVLAAFAATALLGGRALFALARRREEAAWWIWAAGSFVPVAQVFPFLYPMADRYLYFILPGLIGGALLCGGDLLARLPAPWRAHAARAAAALGAAGCLALAVHAGQRAALWGTTSRLLADTVVHYPEGATAHWYRARRAANERDPEGALAALRVATRDPRRGIADVMQDPAFGPLHGLPGFKALMRELATRRIDSLERAPNLTEADLMSLGQAYMLRGEYARAIDALERARARGGAYGERIAEMLAEVRAAEAADTYGAAPAAAP